MIFPVKLIFYLALLFFCSFPGQNPLFAQTQPEPCYRVQTASFLTLEAVNKHMTHLEEVLQLIIPFDSATIRIEQYAPYYTVRVGCFNDHEQMENLLTTLRLYWSDAKPVTSIYLPVQSNVLVERIINRLPPVDESLVENVCNTTELTGNTPEEACFATDDFVFEEPSVQALEEPLKTPASPHKKVEQTVSLAKHEIILNFDYYLLLFFAMLALLSLTITISLRRKFKT